MTTKFLFIGEKYPIQIEEKLFVFDLDDTMYISDEETQKSKERTIINFANACGITENLSEILLEYGKKYGSSIKGILTNHVGKNKEKIDVIPRLIDELSLCMKPDHELNELIRKLPGRKIVFTNGFKPYATKVLQKLDLSDCFSEVYCTDYTKCDFMCKPNESAFLQIQNNYGVKPEEIYFFDDVTSNINQARNLGWNTHLVTKKYDLKMYLKDILRNN